MFVTGDSIVYSASDLAAAARCQYALLREFDAKLGRGPAVAVDDELMARAAVLGSAHEGRRLDQLRHEFGDAVAIIGRPAYTPAGLAAAADATRRAIANHAPVVYQAAMFDGRFVGFADFLIRDGHRYRVADTKLARSPTVTALLQLAAYADALVHSGVPVAADAELELGDGTIVRYRVGELIPVYRSQRALLQRLLDGHYTAGTAVRWDDERVQACFRCPQCTERLRASDDLLLVGGMRVRQRDKLLEAGITTIAELADHTAPVPGLTTNALGKLTAQAKLQIRQRDTGAPQFEIVDPRPLTLLPEPNPGDLFFDFEGDPLWTADGKQWGLEYLFGVLEAGRAGVFRPLWAHDRTAERQALTDFLAIVARRRRRHPNMHIYHYAPYEKTALLRLVGRYGIGEDDVDDLLRNGVLVDLYPLVRKSIRVGTDSFSLKALEPLYLGTQPRSGDVTTAADSINSYARYCELRAAGRIDEAATVLKEIEGYNHYDCRSTRALRDWLLMRAWEAGVTPIGAQPVPDADPIDDGDSLASVLSKFTGDAAAGERTPEQTAVALLAAARGYHRREDKPFWWAHFDRLNYPVDEWSDSTDVFLASEASVTVDWHMPPRARKPQRRVRLTGELARGDLNGNVFALYEPPAPPGMTDNPDRRAAGPAAVVETDDPTVPTEVVIVERTGSDGNTFQQLPFALAPGPPVPTTALRESIESTAAAVASGSPQLPSTALMDVLLRRPPRTRSGAALPRSSDRARPFVARVTRCGTTKVMIIVVMFFSCRKPDQRASFRTPQLRHIGRPVARHGGEPVGRCDQRWPGPGAGRQKAARPHRWALAVDRREPVHRIHPRHRRMRDRRHGVGLRQRQSGAESQPGSAGDRRGWPVLPGQYHRRGARGHKPVAAWRSTATASGKSGHTSRTRRHLRIVVAGRWATHAARRTRLLLRPLVPDAPGGVRGRVGVVLRGQAVFPHRAHRRAPPRRVSPGGAYAWRAPQGQFDRKPRRGRGDPRRAAAAARLAVDRRARHPATGRFRCACARAVQRPGGAGPSAVGVCRTWRG
ncbi:conserved hypothetical protein [Mycobacterium tuberculosis 94_M4241A]|nr:conserved hypothetical protein [Mycobacterium tuberculosis 94_M4241A]